MTDQLYGLNHLIGQQNPDEIKKQAEANQHRIKEALEALRQYPTPEPTVGRSSRVLIRTFVRQCGDAFFQGRRASAEKADHYKRESERKTIEIEVLWQVIDRLHKRLEGVERSG